MEKLILELKQLDEDISDIDPDYSIVYNFLIQSRDRIDMIVDLAENVKKIGNVSYVSNPSEYAKRLNDTETSIRQLLGGQDVDITLELLNDSILKFEKYKNDKFYNKKIGSILPSNSRKRPRLDVTENMEIEDDNLIPEKEKMETNNPINNDIPSNQNASFLHKKCLYLEKIIASMNKEKEFYLSKRKTVKTPTPMQIKPNITSNKNKNIPEDDVAAELQDLKRDFYEYKANVTEMVYKLEGYKEENKMEVVRYDIPKENFKFDFNDNRVQSLVQSLVSNFDIEDINLYLNGKIDFIYPKTRYIPQCISNLATIMLNSPVYTTRTNETISLMTSKIGNIASAAGLMGNVIGGSIRGSSILVYNDDSINALISGISGAKRHKNMK